MSDGWETMCTIKLSGGQRNNKKEKKCNVWVPGSAAASENLLEM